MTDSNTRVKRRCQAGHLKAVRRLTGLVKTLKKAHNTRPLRLARPGSSGRGVVVVGRNVWEGGPGSPFVSSAQPVG